MNRFEQLAIATLLAAVPSCTAQQAVKTQKAPAKSTPAKQEKSTVASPGLVVVKDPETGEIRQATPSEIGDMSPQRSLASDAVAGTPTVKADGSSSMMLGADTMNFVMVTKNPDGKLVVTEVVGDKNAKLPATPATTPKAEYK